MGKKIRYKQVEVVKPDNISLTYLKKLIDNLGKDYSFSMQDLVDFLSENKPA